MNVIQHYDKLIDDNNDPFYDSPELQDYMDKWDGKVFIDSMLLDNTKRVIERAKENLNSLNNVTLICADYEQYEFEQIFDVIYSSLTLIHFEDKQKFISKASSLLTRGGLLCLSIDKDQDDYIHMKDYKIKVFPDKLEHILSMIKTTQLCVKKIIEKEFAHIIICEKN